MSLRLGDILIEQHLITPQELERALAEQQTTQKPLGQVLRAMGLISERKLLQVLAQQQGIAFVELKDIPIEPGLIQKIPAKLVWHYKVMPVSLVANVLTIAVSDPFDVWPIEDLETHLGFRVEKILATSQDISDALKKYYGVGAETIEKILAQESAAPGSSVSADKDKIEDIEKMSEDASVIRLVNQILHEAIQSRATDIHVEIYRDELTLRYRIDGILYDVPVSNDIKYLYPAIISRIKIMSGLDIIERRLPQDGRAKTRIGNKEYDLRTSVIPTIYGENIVLRILPTTMLFDIAQLGMSAQDQETILQLLKKPHGILLVTGPTGSGKTTTLYTALSKLNTRSRKILTIEDPIEYELKGAAQTQVNVKIGLTFAVTLRSMLRHDPDVMMVGEIRDFETAEIAIQTALTGHLVFSTLHTNDAASAVTRLIDIGVEPYLIASSVEAFIAQRLVRVICSHCKEGFDLRSDIVAGEFLAADASLILPESSGVKIYRGKGCKICNQTGYLGRSGIYEILLPREEIKKMIVQKTPSDVIKKQAVALGMRTLKQAGWEKILAGVTTPEEVLRVIQ